MAAFMDLNVCYGETDILQNIVKLAVELTYDVVAINYTVADLQPPAKKKKNQDQDQILSPDKVKLSEEVISKLNITNGRRPFKQLSRFSAVLSDPSKAHRLTMSSILAYDLISVQPANERTFHQACTTLDVDIITIDVTQRLPFYIKRPSINKALERGIHFEIQYSPAVRDSTTRRNTISNALSLMNVCKGKNVILSSGCTKPIELRGPYDVANLGILFGMSKPQGKAAISTNCRAVLCHAESRKILKSTIGVIKSSKIPLKDSWILKQCKVVDEDVLASESDQDESESPRKKLKTSNT